MAAKVNIFCFIEKKLKTKLKKMLFIEKLIIFVAEFYVEISLKLVLNN
jgi:hypothetical protein